MKTSEEYFSTTYEESRQNFRSHLDKIITMWPEAELTSEAIGQEPDNTIDMIHAQARTDPEQVIVMTTGEHGIEGYGGAAVLDLFVHEYLEKIDPKTTGICLIHALNPWGMRNHRRVTENNIDLNRNYFYEDNAIPEDINKNYEKEKGLFLPDGKIEDLENQRKELHGQLLNALAEEGYSRVKEAKGMGQYEFERGVYYGGQAEEETTKFLKRVHRNMLHGYPRVIHMDWHTALGPTNEVTMLVSEKISDDEEQLKKDYQLDNVGIISSDNVKGDSKTYVNKLREEEYPDTYLFSGLFEFGTFGDDKKAEFREFMTIILENQLYWEGAEKEEDRQWILDEFREMFYPDEAEWRESVIKEARRAIEGVLKQEGVLHIRAGR
ncbi:M14 family metallopeptidase [Thalassobacillus pellis]|uniref:M14 family metallopeptidase n=1 Tax=Thalassobacillus pellis TaxID=748008 RepID=UPI001961DD2D|nr:M14 family metallopeptidase [Thalassobacillus pellis]MBM7552125.1 hypothetical protein [Thalassobacillus pellis]